MRTALFWIITQRVVVISYRRFGIIRRSPISQRKTVKPEMRKCKLKGDVNGQGALTQRGVKQTGLKQGQGVL
jgi:hypothetical protein